ncbi:MAG: hypothetical protein WDN67_03115 [Candidatus Moraniibacteriota bacterium]
MNGANNQCSNLGIGSPYQLNVPAQTISFNLTAVSNNTAPNPPAITGPTAGTTGGTYSFTATATDPDSDTIHYGFDWDRNGSIDQWAPASGYVGSGTGQSLGRLFAAASSYTFQVLTQDSKGANSSWTSHTITIADPIAPPAPDLRINNSNGPLTVALNSNLNITWGNVARATSCTGAGAGWPGAKAVTGGSDNIQATATTTYTLTCTGPGGTGTDSVSVSTVGAPIPDLKVNASDGPLTVNQGTNLNLTWGLVANAVSCTGAGASWPGNKSPAGGSDNIQAIATTTYTLTCTNSVGVSGTDSVSVTVLPPIPGQCGAAANFPTQQPPTIGLCRPGYGTPSPVTPASETGQPYTWTCSGTNGGAPAACTAPYDQPAPVPVLRINNSAGPLTVPYGSNLNITWRLFSMPPAVPVRVFPGAERRAYREAMTMLLLQLQLLTP